MIKMTASTAIVLYLAASILLLLGLWLFQHARQRSKLELAPYQLCLCEYCHCLYLAARAKSLSRCPQCLSLNKDNPFHGQ